ncbi:hypothetical protein [Bariatricus sp. HCP28S3_C2]|uniref:hypothetical protein n=1 Tax=unclassified Bariatricus TaxID=2677046 RepID=UPI003F894353
MDSEEYEEWLDYLDNGGTTEEWNRSRTFSEKEGSKRKYKYKNAVVNTSAISSAGYRRKFTDITGENKISRSLWENALDMLEHRSGTVYEDLAFVDSETGNAKINKNYDKENTASPSDSMKKMLKEAKQYTVIAIHNHPGSAYRVFPISWRAKTGNINTDWLFVMMVRFINILLTMKGLMRQWRFQRLTCC